MVNALGVYKFADPMLAFLAARCSNLVATLVAFFAETRFDIVRILS